MATSASSEKTRSASPDKEEDLTIIATEQLREVPHAPIAPIPSWDLTHLFMVKRLPDGVRDWQWKASAHTRRLRDVAGERYAIAKHVFVETYYRKVGLVNQQRDDERQRIYESKGNTRWRLDHEELLQAGRDWENVIPRARRHQQEVDYFSVNGPEDFGPNRISVNWDEETNERHARLSNAIVNVIGLQDRLVDDEPLAESAHPIRHLALEAWERCRDAHDLLERSHLFKRFNFFRRLVANLGRQATRSTGEAALYCCEVNEADTCHVLRTYEACYSPALEYSGYINDNSRNRHFFCSESGFVAAHTKIPTTRDPADPLHNLSYLRAFGAYAVYTGVCDCHRIDFAQSISTYMGFMWALPETVAWWDMLYPVINKILRGHGFAKAFTCLVVGYTSKHELAALVSACLKIATVKTRPLLEPYAALVTQISSASYVSEKARDNTFLAGKNKAPEKSNEDADAENPSKRRRLEIVVE